MKDTLVYPEFREFYDLLSSSGLFTSTLTGNYTDETGSSKQVTAYPNKGHQNISLFDGYHYTVYAPKNAAIQALYAKGYLPSMKDLAACTAAKYGSNANAKIAREVLTQRIKDFVSYHV